MSSSRELSVSVATRLPQRVLEWLRVEDGIVSRSALISAFLVELLRLYPQSPIEALRALKQVGKTEDEVVE